MLKIITRPVSKLLHVLGYRISATYKLIPGSNGQNWAERLKIKTVIDVGSNEGQFIRKINRVLPNAKIVAFEPISSCFKTMVASTKMADVTAFNVALGNEEGSTEINISNNLASSSFLEMKDLHKASFPESVFVKTETVVIKRLDDVLSGLDLPKNILIKLDVQGYEEKVIMGGINTIRNATAIIVETIFEPFYESQWLFDDIYKYFTQAGFKFMGFTEQEHSKSSGIPLFADAIFIRKDMIPMVLS